MTYSHGGMQIPRHFIVLLNPGAASKDLRKPVLPHGSLHVLDLTLTRSGGLNPLRGFSTHTTNHVGMREGLWGPLSWFDVQSRRNRLSDARMKRGSPTWDDEVVLVASLWSTIAITRPRTDEGGVVVQRGSHLVEVW